MLLFLFVFLSGTNTPLFSTSSENEGVLRRILALLQSRSKERSEYYLYVIDIQNLGCLYVGRLLLGRITSEIDKYTKISMLRLVIKTMRLLKESDK